jgi:two-component system, OmpR family, phosphate regulon response regulator PhoB
VRSTLGLMGPLGASEQIRSEPCPPPGRRESQLPGLPRAVSILIVDDDPAVRNLIGWQLELDGHGFIAVANGGSALAAIAGGEIALVVLDLSLPDMSGLDLLRHIRQTTALPVIIVSGRVGEADRIAGLDLGADDYMTKPFSPGELSSRVRAVMRRTSPVEPTQLLFENLRIDLSARQVFVNDRPIELAPREFEVLAFLAGSPRTAFTRSQLLQQVWRSSSGWHDEATVTQHVHRVRHKIEPNPDKPRWLKTVSRVGYRFEP